ALLGRPESGHAELPDLLAHPGSVIAADGVVVGDRPAVVEDRAHGGLLGRAPLVELRALVGPGHEREVERGPGGIEVRHVAAHDRPRAWPGQSPGAIVPP